MRITDRITQSHGSHSWTLCSHFSHHKSQGMSMHPLVKILTHILIYTLTFVHCKHFLWIKIFYKISHVSILCCHTKLLIQLTKSSTLVRAVTNVCWGKRSQELCAALVHHDRPPTSDCFSFSLNGFQLSACYSCSRM